MKLIPEVEFLRSRFQESAMEHIRLEIEIALTFVGLGRVEYGMGSIEAGSTSFYHARQALTGARRGLSHLADESHRATFESKIVEVEAALTYELIRSERCAPLPPDVSDKHLASF
jgi:hypothetical protein